METPDDRYGMYEPRSSSVPMTTAGSDEPWLVYAHTLLSVVVVVALVV